MAKTHKDRREVQNPMQKPVKRGESAKILSLLQEEQDLIRQNFYKGGAGFRPKR